MKTIKYGNGAELTYDDTITVGALITTSHPGYHVLAKIEFREQCCPLFHYIQVLLPNGLASRPFEKCCDATWCRKVMLQDVQRQRDEAIQFANQRFNAIAGYL